MPNAERPEFVVEDCGLMYKNFSGAAQRFNAEGDRNFCAVIPHELAEQLEKDGFNVKYVDPLDEGDPQTAYIKVKLSWKYQAPLIYLVSGETRRLLGEGSVGLLDSLEHVTCDISVQGSQWETASGSGMSAYLKKMYFEMKLDPLDSKWGGTTLVMGDEEAV